MLDLAAIQARCEAATPGPWKRSNYRPNRVICRDPKESTYARGDDEFPTLLTCDPEDAAFIAHARSDIPALLAEVQRLRGLVEAAYTEGAHDRAHVGKWDAFWWDVSKSKRLLDGGTDGTV